MCNWASSERDLELTRSLVDEEISHGWVYKFDGDLFYAQAVFPHVAIATLDVATSDTRPHDWWLTIALRPQCEVPYTCRSTLSTTTAVLRSFPIRGRIEDIMAMSPDINQHTNVCC